MSGGKRIARLNEQLKRELSEMIRTQVRDPRVAVGTVTVTGVEVTTDLGHAKVHVRVTGGRPEVRETLTGLQAAAPYLRTLLGKELSLRRVPELTFWEDRSLEQALRIEEVLAQILPRRKETPEDAGEDEG